MKEIESNLTNILHAYANLDPEIGYTQGIDKFFACIYYLVSKRNEFSGCNSTLSYGSRKN